MKNSLFCLTIAALLALPLLSQDEPEPQSQPEVSTYNLLPAQTLNLHNRKWHFVEIRTDYPVQLAAGPCHNDSTVQWRCYFKDDPADLFIRDLRVPPIFTQPRANVVTVTKWTN
jgi:hypothetical protein